MITYEQKLEIVRVEVCTFDEGIALLAHHFRTPNNPTDVALHLDARSREIDAQGREIDAQGGGGGAIAVALGVTARRIRMAANPHDEDARIAALVQMQAVIAGIATLAQRATAP